MHKNTRKTTILALDLRLQRFGFGVLEGQPQLLDWGIKTYRATDTHSRALVVRKRVVPLLTLFRPSVIVANHVSGLHVSRGPGHYHIVRAIEHEAREQSAELILLGRKEIQRVFGKGGQSTKDEIAAQVALLFPELTWKLPSVRKTWESEHHNMTLFDAIALGITYLARFGDVFLANNPQPEVRTPG
jgi:hypothetical protein